MKRGFAPLLVIIILLGTLCVFGFKYLGNQNNSQKDLEISQLKEQIKIAREDLVTKPSPSPAPPQPVSYLVLDKSKITPQNFYTLGCWHRDTIEKAPITKELKSHLDPNEQIVDLCSNTTLNKTVLLTLNSGQGLDLYRGYFLKVYDLKSQSLVTASTQIHGGGGVCQIDTYLWSKENDLYYKMIFCEGDSSNPFESIFKIHMENI